MKPRPAFLPLLPLRNRGDSGDKPAKPSNHAGLRPVGQWGQIGDKAGTKWGHFYMMKIHSIIHVPSLARPQPRPGCPESAGTKTITTAGTESITRRNRTDNRPPVCPLLACHALVWKWARRGLSLEPFTGRPFPWGRTLHGPTYGEASADGCTDTAAARTGPNWWPLARRHCQGHPAKKKNGTFDGTFSEPKKKH